MSVGILLSIVGALLTITGGNFSAIISNGLAIGDIYMITAVLCWAGYSILIKKAVSSLSPLVVLTYGAIMGIILLLPFTFYENGWSTLHNLTWPIFLSLLYLGFFAAGIAYLWYFQGIKKVGSSVSSVFLNLEPVAAIAIGILLLDEKLTLPLAIGAVLVISGLFLTAYRKKV
jgi:drug/metabolite transporter (DMT)-like permease